MTKQEAAIISAYTGILIGEFSDMHDYINSLDVFNGITTIGLATHAEQIKQAAKGDFLNIKITDESES